MVSEGQYLGAAQLGGLSQVPSQGLGQAVGQARGHLEA